MADVVDKTTRSRMMSGIRGKNTRPEMIVRKILHARGFRYRLHDARIPGKPDIVLRKHRAVIFVNGCFWHGHECHLFKWPTTRESFWRDKIGANVARDAENRAQMANGWRCCIVWECALKGRAKLTSEGLGAALEAWLLSGEETAEIEGNDDAVD